MYLKYRIVAVCVCIMQNIQIIGHCVNAQAIDRAKRDFNSNIAYRHICDLRLWREYYWNYSMNFQLVSRTINRLLTNIRQQWLGPHCLRGWHKSIILMVYSVRLILLQQSRSHSRLCYYVGKYQPFRLLPTRILLRYICDEECLFIYN